MIKLLNYYLIGNNVISKQVKRKDLNKQFKDAQRYNIKRIFDSNLNPIKNTTEYKISL